MPRIVAMTFAAVDMPRSAAMHAMMATRYHMRVRTALVSFSASSRHAPSLASGTCCFANSEKAEDL